MASADDDVREIQLSGKQLVFLFMAVTVVSVVIFLCGVLVGRGVQLRPAAAIEQGSAAPAEVVPDPTAPVEQPVAPTNEPTKATGLGYQEDLKARTPTTDKVVAAPPAPVKPVDQGAPASRTAPPVSTPPADTPPPASAAPGQAAVTAPAAKASEPAAPAATPSKLFPEPRGDGFAIQVTALSGKTEAEAIADRLKRKGYAVYLVSAPPGQPATYKVRVGKFRVRTEAEKIASRLEREEQFKPWITR